MTEERRKVLGHHDLKAKLQIMTKLPPELCHYILSFVPKNKIDMVYLRGNHGLPPTKVKLPVTTHAGDRLLRQETIMVTVESTTWSIHSWPGNQAFQAWLDGLDLSLASKTYKNGCDAVKSLMFEFFSRFPYHSYRPHTRTATLSSC